MARRVIAITGATGQQGGAVLRALQLDPQLKTDFQPRVVIRNEALRASFEEQGCQVAIATLEDQEALTTAFQGCHGLFAVTPRTFGEDHIQVESQMGRNMAQAAAAAKVAHVVWSTMEDTRTVIPTDSATIPTVYGVYKCPLCDVKADIDLEFQKSKVPTSLLLLSGFFENFLTFWTPKRSKATGRAYLSLTAPADLTLALHSVNDIGRAAAAIFAQGEAAIGGRFTVATHLTMQHVTNSFSKVLGEPFDYVPKTPEELRSQDFPEAATLANYYQYMDEFSQENLRLHPNNALCEPLEHWLIANKGKIKITEEE